MHSNAFNFLSYLTSGVDPRTGLYTISIALPKICANALSGPELPLTLVFSSMQSNDRGLGIGWGLQLSCYDPRSRQLSLSSGDTYKATDVGTELLVTDQKLRSFRIEKEGTRLRLIHKSGMIESLLLGQESIPVYLPTMITSPQGRSVYLEYGIYDGHRVLSEVRDEHQRLLMIERNDSQVSITLYPDSPQAARYGLVLTNNRITQLKLPVANQACWRFQYRSIQGQPFLTEVQTPTGAVETIRYADSGHAFPPKAPLQYLPYVVEHVRMPGLEQAAIVTTYQYSARNFLGHGAPNLNWSDDGDNLYKVLTDYQYHSIESLVIGDGSTRKIVRSIKRVYNRFHLLVSEETSQKEHVKLQSTEYYERPGLSFTDQPAQCQLPKRATTTYFLRNTPTLNRIEVTETEFDEYGNLLRKSMPTGVEESYFYYAKEGEVGCPADPLGFVRSVKQKTVTPTADKNIALILQTRYQYMALPSLHAGGVAFLMPIQEALYELVNNQANLRHQNNKIYINNLADTFLHGRLALDSIIRNDLTNTSFYRYRTENEELITETVFTGFDGSNKSLTSHRSILSGLDLSSTNGDGVTLHTNYDSLGRIVSETTAKGTEFEATRRYAYLLAVNKGDSVEQLLTDVNGVQTRTILDGLQREVRVETQDVDQDDMPFRLTYEAYYDALGQLIEETKSDWLNGTQLRLSTRFEYDDWGNVCNTIRPDAVSEHRITDPILLSETTWLEGSEGSRGSKTVTINNLFEKPLSVERFDRDRLSLGKTAYEYDGLGRCVCQIDPLQNITRFRYDHADRLIATTLPDNTLIECTYTLHSEKELPTELRVNHVSAGQQWFDGLERLSERCVGGRQHVFQYEGSQLKPASERTPRGECIFYQYQSQLNQQLTRRVVAGKETRYTYHPQHAQLMRSFDAANNDVLSIGSPEERTMVST